MELTLNVLRLVVAAAIALWAVLAWRRAREKRRRWKLDLCPACGYDLRESSHRCPECGRPITRFPRDNSQFTVPKSRSSP
jgi:rRNA maturation endonuclease Nob1